MKSLPLLLAATLLLDSPLHAAEPAPGALLPGGPAAWTLAWSEEFDGPDAKLDDRWISQNSPSTHILSSRWRENAVVANGTLKLLNKKEKRGGQEWTSGSIWTREHFQYGYFNGKELRREKNEFCHSPAPVWLSLAIIGWGGKITDAIDGTFMEVDYVRIYKAKKP